MRIKCQSYHHIVTKTIKKCLNGKVSLTTPLEVMEILYYKTTKGSSRLSRSSQSKGRPNRMDRKRKIPWRKPTALIARMAFPHQEALLDYNSEQFDTAHPRAMTGICVRREKAALSSGCKSHPANAPAGSNRSSHGGDEMAEAFGVAGHI